MATTNESPLCVVDVERIHAHGAALSDLDQWDSALTQLDLALVDAPRARDRLTENADALAVIEAHVTLTIEGRNETERKANLILALAGHQDYQHERACHRDARLKLADAERRITIGKERCRLLRAAVALQVSVED